MTEIRNLAHHLSFVHYKVQSICSKLDILHSDLLDFDILKLLRTAFEQRHGISKNVVCASSKASDQPAHTRSLIRTFASRLNIL